MAFGYCSTHQRDPSGHRGCLTCIRIKLEGEVAADMIDALLSSGFFIDVFDCEEFTLKNSRDKAAILEAMFTTDDDRLYVRQVENGPRIGWVWFVYGNGGWDVIADHTVNLSQFVDPIIEKYSG